MMVTSVENLDYENQPLLMKSSFKERQTRTLENLTVTLCSVHTTRKPYKFLCPLSALQSPIIRALHLSFGASLITTYRMSVPQTISGPRRAPTLRIMLASLRSNEKTFFLLFPHSPWTGTPGSPRSAHRRSPSDNSGIRSRP